MNKQVSPTMEPHSVDAEEAVLGSVLIDPEALNVVKNTLTRSDFYLEKNGMIWDAMISMSEHSIPIDFLTLIQEMEKRGELAGIGGKSYIAHLMSIVPTSIHAHGYADMVVDKATRRRLLSFCSDIASASYNSHELPDIIHHARQSLNRISTRVISEPEAEDKVCTVPELPDDARVEYNPADGAGWFIDAYTHYAMAISPMSPASFHESAALWIGDLAIARRIKAAMGFDDVYPNLFVAWVAPSTVWHKTTSLNVARRLISRTFSHLLLSSDITPQQLLSSMAGVEPSNKLFLTEKDVALWNAGRGFAAQRGMCMDELSGMMATSGRDYNAGLIEYLMRFYNCEDTTPRETKADGLIVVRNAYLSLISASTPLAMSPSMLNETLWSGGWWPRFALITPETGKPDFVDVETEAEEPQDLITALQRLYNRLPVPTWPDTLDAKSVIIEPDAMRAWKRYFKAVSYDMVTETLDHRLNPVYGRLHIHALKAAIIMATLDWGCEKDVTCAVPVVRLPHLARAIQIAESWRSSAHRLLADVTMGEANRFLQRVLAAVISSGQHGITLRDLYKSLSKPPFEVENALNQLMSTTEVETFEGRNSKGGPKSVRYRRAIG
jgi:hypothetical protein